MSHFTVLVIGDDIERQLQPFHEYECTGIEDEFVKDIDITAEAREQYAKSTETRLKGRDGTLHSFFDAAGNWRPEFSQLDPDAPSWDTNRRTRFVPEGFEQIEVPTSEVETFAEWVEGYYGKPPRIVDGVEKVIKRTNPNRKWDWWQVGGRWSGLLKLKPGRSGANGEPGLMGSHFAKGADRADQALKGDIDLDGMRDDAGTKAGALWDKAHALTGGAAWEAWDSVRDRLAPDYEAARTFYNGQAPVKTLKEGDHDTFGWELDDALSGTREAFVQAARDRALTTFAVVYRGESEKGRMGWFACVSDEMEQGNWNRMFNDLIDGLPDDALLTVVDCHI